MCLPSHAPDWSPHPATLAAPRTPGCSACFPGSNQPGRPSGCFPLHPRPALAAGLYPALPAARPGFQCGSWDASRIQNQPLGPGMWAEPPRPASSPSTNERLGSLRWPDGDASAPAAGFERPGQGAWHLRPPASPANGRRVGGAGGGASGRAGAGSSPDRGDCAAARAPAAPRDSARGSRRTQHGGGGRGAPGLPEREDQDR